MYSNSDIRKIAFFECISTRIFEVCERSKSLEYSKKFESVTVTCIGKTCKLVNGFERSREVLKKRWKNVNRTELAIFDASEEEGTL